MTEYESKTTANPTASAPPGMAPSELAARVLAEAQRARVVRWGLREYGEVLAVQESLREQRRGDAIPDTWLAGEHHGVITLGVRGDAATDIRDAASGGAAAASDQETVSTDDDSAAPPAPQRETPRSAGGLPVYRIDRGGQTTLHNPGQLVIYPIVKTGADLLAQARLSRALLETTRDWIAEKFGVALEIPRGRPGLFHGERKAAAIGVSIRRRVSMHGIAINLCNDLAPWAGIVACGEPQTRPITLSEILGRRVAPADMLVDFDAWLREAWGYGAVERAEEVFPA